MNDATERSFGTGGRVDSRPFWFLAVLVPFVLMGIADWVLTVADAGLDSGTLLELGLSLGLWVLLACLVALAEAIVGRLVLGRKGIAGGAEWLIEWIHRIWSERGTLPDRLRVAGLAAFIAGLLTFAGASVVFITWLVKNKHGEGLIAATAVAGQLALAVFCVLVSAVLYRLLAWVFGCMKDRGVLARIFSLPVVLSLGLVAVIGGVAAAMVILWETVEAVDGIAFLLPAMALLLQLPAYLLVRTVQPTSRWVPRTVVLGVLLLALLAIMGFGQSGRARQLALQFSYTAKYKLSFIQRGSDVDRDGVPYLPAFNDCAPFDPKVHPFAREKVGNGIDENCDGLDSAPDSTPYLAKRMGLYREVEEQPDVILISWDAVRADHMGFMGYERDTTPDLDPLVADAVVFAHAFSQDSGTGPSFWSLMTGKTPFQTKLKETGRFPPALQPSETTLAELFRKNGYQTTALLCGSVFRAPHWNIKRGFADGREVCGSSKQMQAEKVYQQATMKLRSLRLGDKPFFMWVHFFDPHHGYTDHKNLNFGKKPKDKYDEEIRYSQEYIARLVREARSLNGKRPVYIALTGDHGENFGDHGKSHHARTLYREVTNVPVVFWGDDLIPDEIDAPIAVGDIYPTLAELAGIEVGKAITMTSQVPVLMGELPDYSRFVFHENSFGRPLAHLKGVVRDRYHMILDTTNYTTELFDYIDDPGEKNNLAGLGLSDESDLYEALLWLARTTFIPPGLR